MTKLVNLVENRISKISKEKDPILEFEIETTKIYSLTEDNQEKLVNQEYQRIIKGEENDKK